MKKWVLIFATLFSGLCSAQYNHSNIGLYAVFDDPAVKPEPLEGLRYSGCYGYYDSVRKKEYGIIGGNNGTYIIDVTEPRNPVKVAFFAGAKQNCRWREFKTYQHYLYAVSDDPDDSVTNSLQIFDLGQLPPVKVYDSDSLFSRAHTIFVDGNKLYAASVKKLYQLHYRMAVYSLEDPVNPRFLRAIDQDDSRFTDDAHDMYARNDSVFVSFGYAGLDVYTFDEQNPSFTLIGELNRYPYEGYNHSSALTPDHNTLIFTDELPNGLPAKKADVSDLLNIRVTAEFVSNTDPAGNHPTPHNPYLWDAKTLVLSYYMDGIQVFDISDSLPRKLGYFDTYPYNGNTYPQGLDGCWGAYVQLPSGTLIASDTQGGMFILNMDTLYHPEKYQFTGTENVKVFPNPFTSTVSVKGLNLNQANEYFVYDETGKMVYHTVSQDVSYTSDIDLSALPRGFYILKVNAGSYYSGFFRLVK